MPVLQSLQMLAAVAQVLVQQCLLLSAALGSRLLLKILACQPLGTSVTQEAAVLYILLRVEKLQRALAATR